MKLNEALSTLHSATEREEIKPLDKTDDASIDAVLKQARRIHAEFRKTLKACQSDNFYWGCLGDVVVWKTFINILSAAKIAGPNNLPDIPPPDVGKRPRFVMDSIADLDAYGKAILKTARKKVKDGNK